jgi:hypothetical protein
MALHTLRGQLEANELRRLILDDGMFTEGHKIESFEVWAISIASGDDPAAILALSDKIGTEFDAGDSRQIGWAMQTTSATSRIMSFNTLDPDHVILRDLYIRNISAHPANYLITVVPIKITEDQAVLQLIKESSQDV